MSSTAFQLTAPPGAYWSADRNAWDQESGRPGIAMFGDALQVWAVLQPRRVVTVAEAAAAFCVPAKCIEEAVEDHPWMLLNRIDPDGADTPWNTSIEHDGE